MFFNGKASWIAPADGVTRNNGVASCMIFRRKFNGRGKLHIAVCADSEYRLYCNGILTTQGPAYGDSQVTFYDESDISPLLNDEENILTAEVICFAGAFPDFYRGGAPMGRMTLREAFILDGTLYRVDGSEEFIGTGETWEAAAHPYLQMSRCPQIPCAGPGEKYCLNNRKKPLFYPVQKIEAGFTERTVKNSILSYRLAPRMIPFMQYETAGFAAVFDLQGISKKEFSQPYITLKPDHTADFVLDAAGEVTARINLEFIRGSAEVKIFYAESLFDGKSIHFSPENKHDPITGPMIDEVSSTGGKWCWRSFFYRAFRFVRVKIKSGSNGCTLRIKGFEKEFYPYEMRGAFQSGNPLYNKFWEIGIRTLQMCSHQIFEDCPCYERMQYPADARIAAKVALTVSGDDRLARQAILHFRHSIQDTGLTAGSYPSRSPVYLPPWSLHYAAMVYELYQYTGDQTLLDENFIAIGRVLEFFLQHRCSTGGIGKLPFWEMADFSPQWLWFGEPPEVAHQASAYITFLVTECLEFYSEMARMFHRDHEAAKYAAIAGDLKKEANIFYDEQKQLYADTPGGEKFSILANSQAILAGISADKTLVSRCMQTPGAATPSLFGCNFVFEALMKSGEAETAAFLLERWQKLLIPGRTVWPEGTPIPRSECHVWSSLPTLALVRLYTGLTIVKPGGSEIALKPFAPSDEPCSGIVPLATGLLKYHFDGQKFCFELPADTTAIMPDGRKSRPGKKLFF
ncbi:MAG: hypothetical protein E7053_00445 [Lentisphaerae bacterium]|nr:hypothetical protein [Lentisphaerota bacterium]